MEFLGMGMMEIVMIALVALIVLGPDRLPAYARKASRFIRQLRKITSGITQEVNRALELEDYDGEGIKKELKEISKSLEEDAAMLRKSLSDDTASLEKAVNKGVQEVNEGLTKGSAEISHSLKKSAKSAEKNLAEGIAEAKQNLGVESSAPEAMVEYKPPSPTSE